jgi:hypothetical protein
MIHIRRRHTAGRGREVILTISDDVYDVLVVAVEVAFDDPEAVPAEFAGAADELWQAVAAGVRGSAATREP